MLKAGVQFLYKVRGILQKEGRTWSAEGVSQANFKVKLSLKLAESSGSDEEHLLSAVRSIFSSFLDSPISMLLNHITGRWPLCDCCEPRKQGNEIEQKMHKVTGHARNDTAFLVLQETPSTGCPSLKSQTLPSKVAKVLQCCSTSSLLSFVFLFQKAKFCVLFPHARFPLGQNDANYTLSLWI